MKRRIILPLILAAVPFASFAADVDEETIRNWPHWRGPVGTGVAPEGRPPLEWDAERNVVWKFDDPGLGYSSPIVWNDRVFVTTVVAVPRPGEDAEPEYRGVFGAENLTDPRHFLVIALDRATGTELWRRNANETVPHEGHHGTLSSFANMSPVTDGEHLYVSFGSYGLYAFDLDGNPTWSRDFGVAMQIFNRFGESSSPALWKNTLVLNFDGENDSFVVAIDKRNGETLWRKERDEATTWTSPFIVEHESIVQAIVSGANFVRSYALETGEELWRVSGMTNAPVPTPVPGFGMVFLASGTNGQAFKAVKLGGVGDLTATAAEVWTVEKGVSYNPTPLLWGDELYMVKEGMRGPTFVSAFDARTGEKHYFNARLPEPWVIRASPVGADGRIYLSTEEGDVVVLRRGPELEILAVNSMGEQMIATPAIAGRDIFVRTRESLYRIGGQ